jgi:Flp pilus assembly pilin Flp
VTDKPAPLRPLAEVLDEIRAEEELEELAAMDPAVLEKELVDSGYDPARLEARIAAAREAAYAKPAGEVVQLSAARAKKAAARTHWGLLAAAASVALIAGFSGEHYLATSMPATTVTYATVGKPLSPWERAAPLRRQALRACAQGYYGECSDALDEARNIDPEGEKDAAVQAARVAIAEDHVPEVYAKPHVGPRERPLQRHP